MPHHRIPTGALNVIHANAAGLDVHKMQITATARLARRIAAAVMEVTGVYWEAVFDALESAGVEPLVVHAQHVKQIRGRKTDVADSV